MRVAKWFRTLMAPLGHRQFALIWAGQNFSAMGDEAFSIALVWLLTGLTGSTLLIGTVLTVSYIPILLTQWLGGVLADRVSRRAIMVASDLLRLGVTAVFAALVILKHISIEEIFIFAAIYGLVNGFFNPAAGALRLMLLRRDEFAAANAIMQVGQQVALLAGPALGGFLIAQWNVGAALAFDALTFAAAALATILMGRVRAVEVPSAAELTAPSAASDEPPRKRRLGGLGGIGEALSFIWGEKGLLAIILFFSLTNGINNVITVLTPVLVRQTLRLPATVFGLAGTCAGVATLLGALVLGGLVRKMNHPTPIVFGAMVIFGGGIVAMGLATSALTLYGAFFVTFLGFIIAEIIMSTLWQLAIPDRMRGRVFSIVSTIAMAMNPLGFLFAGALGDAYGVRAGLWIGGGLIVVLALLVYLLPVVRKLDARARELLAVPSVADEAK